VIALIKIGNVYNMGDFFMPHMVEHAEKIMATYGAGFGVVGFEGTDLKGYLLWIIDNIIKGIYPACGLYIKESYIDFYRPSDNIWVNMWRLAMHLSPIGLDGELVLIPYVNKYPFYKLATIRQIEQTMKSSNITDINMLSIFEKKLFQTKVEIVSTMAKEELAQIDWLVCHLYNDPMMASLSGSLRRRFKTTVREVCNDKL
jgi:hypothetical protein